MEIVAILPTPRRHRCAREDQPIQDVLIVLSTGEHLRQVGKMRPGVLVDGGEQRLQDLELIAPDRYAQLDADKPRDVLRLGKIRPLICVVERDQSLIDELGLQLRRFLAGIGVEAEVSSTRLQLR